MNEKINIALKIINEINSFDDKYMPKIGGPLALYYYGIVNNVNDIDIIVNDIDGINLPYNKIPLVHSKRLNKTISYDVNGVKVDIIESLMPRKYNGYFEDVDNILYSKKIIKRFINLVYNKGD